MARLFRPVTRMISSSPEATASSTTYWMVGLSTSGSISLGWALVAGRKRVPSPAAGNTAFLTFMRRPSFQGSWRRGLVLRDADLDPELLHPIPEAPLGDPEEPGGPGLDPAGLLERVEDHAPLPLGQHIVERGAGRHGELARRPAGHRAAVLNPRRQMLGEDDAVGEDHGRFEDMLQLADIAGPRVRPQAAQRLGRDRRGGAPY